MLRFDRSVSPETLQRKAAVVSFSSLPLPIFITPHGAAGIAQPLTFNVPGII